MEVIKAGPAGNTRHSNKTGKKSETNQPEQLITPKKTPKRSKIPKATPESKKKEKSKDKKGEAMPKNPCKFMKEYLSRSSVSDQSKNKGKSRQSQPSGTSAEELNNESATNETSALMSYCDSDNIKANVNSVRRSMNDTRTSEPEISKHTTLASITSPNGSANTTTLSTSFLSARSVNYSDNNVDYHESDTTISVNETPLMTSSCSNLKEAVNSVNKTTMAGLTRNNKSLNGEEEVDKGLNGTEPRSKEEGAHINQNSNGNKDNQRNPEAEQIMDTAAMLKSVQEAGDMPISNALVIDMFQKLMQQMSTVKNDITREIQELKTDKEASKQEIAEIKTTQNEQATSITQMQATATVSEQKMEKMVDTMLYQKQIIDELVNKVDMLENEKTKPNIIIQGILETKGENTVNKVKEFFKKELELVHDVAVKAAFRLGKGKKRPIKVMLKNTGDKGLIYTNAKKLQEKKNSKGGGYRIEDELPPKQRETRKKHRNIAWRNKNSVANKLEMSLKKGKLTVNEQPYQSSIVQPDKHKLLKLSPEEIKELNKIPVAAGVSVECETSVFQGYVCDAQNYNEVNAAYEYVTYHNMGGATHHGRLHPTRKRCALYSRLL